LPSYSSNLTTRAEQPPEATPIFLSCEKKHDVFDSNAAHARIVGKALKYIERYKEKQFFFFFHFSDPD